MQLIGKASAGPICKSGLDRQPMPGPSIIENAKDLPRDASRRLRLISLAIVIDN